MFSDNHKISARQLKRMLVLDLIGKVSLLLPAFAGVSSGRDFMVSLIAGLVLAVLYVFSVGYLAKYVENDFGGFVEARLGHTWAYLLRFFYLAYVFINLTYLCWLFAAVTKTFLLPEMNVAALAAVMLLCGYYGASKGVEGRGRTAEVLYKLILIPLLVMLLFGAFSIDSEYLSPGTAAIGSMTMKQGFLVFTAFGGAGLLLYQVPMCSQKERLKRTVVHGTGLVAGSVFAAFVVMIGAFGAEGMRALPWPAVTLMSNVNLPGDFLQRWDAIFLSLLLLSFFVASSTQLYYMGFLAQGFFHTEEKEMQKDRGRRQSICMAVGALLVFMAFNFSGTYETAFFLFRILNCYILVPLTAGFTLLLCVIERVRQGKKLKKRTAAAALLLCMGAFCSVFVSGCGRELEDRTFPSMLLVQGDNLDEVLEGWQQEEDKYTDFGHVKAVVFDEKFAEDRPFLKEVLRYMEQDPVFARNMLIFFADDTALDSITYKASSFGAYLEDRYKNGTGPEEKTKSKKARKKGKEGEITLGDLLNFLHNQEEEISVPKIVKTEKSYSLEESIRLTNGDEEEKEAE